MADAYNQGGGGGRAGSEFENTNFALDKPYELFGLSQLTLDQLNEMLDYLFRAVSKLAAPKPDGSPWQTVFKLTDERRTNNAGSGAFTPHKDDELKIFIEYPFKYRVRIGLIPTQLSNDGDFRWSLTGPENCAVIGLRLVYNSTGGTQAIAAVTTLPDGSATAGTINQVSTIYYDIVVSPVASGTLLLKWVGDDPAGANCILKAGSYIEYTKVE